MLIHSVYFTLSEANQKEEDALLEACRELAHIPSVKNFSTGKMIPSERPVVQSDYHVAIAMDVENAEGLESYQTHPIHVAFIEKWIKSKVVAQVKVYDFA